MAFTTIPSSEQMVSMFKNGRSKERNAGMNGRHRQRKRVRSISIARTKTKIFFLLESQSKSDIIVRNGTEKRLRMLGITWGKALSLVIRQINMKEWLNIGRSVPKRSICLCREALTSTNTSWNKRKNTMKV